MADVLAIARWRRVTASTIITHHQKVKSLADGKGFYIGAYMNERINPMTLPRMLTFG